MQITAFENSLSGLESRLGSACGKTIIYSRTRYFEVPGEMGKKFEIAGFQNNRGSVKGKGKSRGIRSSFEIAGTLN